MIKTEEIRKIYQEKIYGVWRSGEQVTYELLGPDEEPSEEERNPFKVRGGELVKICVRTEEASAEFIMHAFLPDEEHRRHEGGSPFIVCMHPIMPKDLALERGYALLVMDSLQIASDDIKHEGAFYELYPYGKEASGQTGVLMAWAWGASKILDAVYNGLAEEFRLDPEASMVTGVSRWGKATAVCGAFDERFRMTIPACSGAGGLALFNVFSEGKTYDLRDVGGPADYTYGKNEPLDCLQSDAERGWFNDAFLEFKSPSDIPVEQDKLPVAAMAPDRYYFIIAACMGEDWVNAPSMWECYKLANKEYEAAGLADHLVVNFHKEGHAVIEEDMELIIAYFDKMYFKQDTDVDMKRLKTSVFE